MEYVTFTISVLEQSHESIDIVLIVYPFQIVYVLQTTTKYSILQASTIEDIDVYAKKFVDFYKNISSQKYDALNHRLPYFEKDYNQFKQNVVDTEWELEEFVGASLEKMTDVDNILRLLKR